MNPASKSGVVVVDKPRGCTSFDVVAQARRLFGTRSVGHAGTLDPMATGVLLILLDEGTKLSAALTCDDKSYDAEVHFGRSTDSFDADGVTTNEGLHALPPPEALAAALQVERERRRQLPPAHSAVKIQGQRAYTLARRGEAVELAPRDVAIRSIEVLGVEVAVLRVRLAVSKGYYVRAFVRDLCETLGVPGHLCALRRTASGPFTLDEAISWPPSAPPAPMPLAAAASRAMPWGTLTPAGVIRARQGKVLGGEDFTTPPEGPGLQAWLDPGGGLVALGERTDDGFRVRRGFTDRCG